MTKKVKKIKMIDSWDDAIPDPSSWTPRVSVRAASLKRGLQLTCQVVQQRIIAEAGAEMQFNIDNFDSGAGVEELTRRELRRLLPTRYDVTRGVINDSSGLTGGDCDLVIANLGWAPFVKLGATDESRRQHIPIEAVYSIVEIKQSASYSALDEAMKKLVRVGRLSRAINPYGHITENQHLPFFDRPNMILNPLLSVAFMARPSDSASFENLAKRFFRVNSVVAKATGRDSLVKMLCVLNGGLAYYSVRGEGGFVDADFSRDRDCDLVETTISTSDDSFYAFFVLLLGHLTRSVLNIVDITRLYGSAPSLQRKYHDTLTTKS